MKQQKNSPASALARFGRDKRVRGEETAADPAGQRPRTPRAEGGERPRRDAKPGGRASYNPNFTADNRPVFETHSDEERPRRTFGDRTRTQGDRGRTFGERGRAQGDRPRTFGEKPRFGASEGKRPGGKPFGGPKFAPREEGERRFDRARDERSHGDRPRTFGDGQRGAGRSFTDRRGGDKPAFRGGDSRSSFRGDAKPSFRGGDSKAPFRREGKPAFRRDEKPAYPRYNPEKQTGAMRLNRFIAQSGICSRREADDFILAGLVSVNGQVVTELGTKVMPTDEVKFNDSRVQGQKKVYLVLNKPKGYVTSLDDPHAGKTVMELVEGACSERIYPVGRLDKNSLGLLLFTNDGDLTKQLTHPSYKKKKIYQVTLDKPLTRADMDRIAEGITLEDGEIFADEISYVKENKQEVGIEIHSGRNRIVRRIFEFLGYTVTKLDRVYYAGLTKKNLNRGRWRFLTDEEVQRLKSGQYE